MSSIQINSYGACLRIATDNTVLLLSKSQVRVIEVVRDDTIKLSLGQGTLQEILIKLAEVTVPAGLPDVAALRDAIAHMLDNANLFEENALLKMQCGIDQLIEMKQLLNLCHSSQQIDLNFQQLQANALVAIGNRLLEAKENDERLISNVSEQTISIKQQTVTLSGFDIIMNSIKTAIESAVSKQDISTSILTAIKTSSENFLNKQDISTSLLGSIKTVNENSLNKQDYSSGILTEIKVVLADILNELKAHTNLLNPISTTLNDIRSQNSTTHNKLDNHSQLLGDIKVAISNIH